MKPAPPNYGSYSSEKKALQAVLDRLIAALKPFRIYLFGSRAEGRARPDSDFDLVVVFDDQAANANADNDDVYAPLLGLGIGCDVVPCRWADFQEILADSSNPWARTLALARRIYERPDEANRGLSPAG